MSRMARMSRTARNRTRIVNFEARSVQLIAACTLGLAGLASLPNPNTARQAGTSTTSTSHSQPAPAVAPGAVVRRHTGA